MMLWYKTLKFDSDLWCDLCTSYFIPCALVATVVKEEC